MTEAEAKSQILSEWRTWTGQEYETGANDFGFNDALRFYEQLQHSRLKLLSFKYDGDKWELVKSWLLSPDFINRRTNH